MKRYAAKTNVDPRWIAPIRGLLYATYFGICRAANYYYYYYEYHYATRA